MIRRVIPAPATRVLAYVPLWAQTVAPSYLELVRWRSIGPSRAGLGLEEALQMARGRIHPRDRNLVLEKMRENEYATAMRLRGSQ